MSSVMPGSIEDNGDSLFKLRKKFLQTRIVFT